jgi:hypothetical protein
MVRRAQWMLGLVLLAGCGGAIARTQSPRIEPSESSRPLPSLRGVVAGLPWQARSAVAYPGVTEAPERYVLIYAFETTCESAREAADLSSQEHFVGVTVPWRTGVHLSAPDGSFDEERLSRSGELTLLRASRVHGGTARLRLEMAGDDPVRDQVAGEIDVIDCAP